MLTPYLTLLFILTAFWKSQGSCSGNLYNADRCKHINQQLNPFRQIANLNDHKALAHINDLGAHDFTDFHNIQKCFSYWWIILPVF